MSILDRKKAGAHLAKKKSAEEKPPKETKEAGETAEKKKPKEKKKRTRKEKLKLAATVVLIVLTAIAALIVVAYAIYRSWAKPPELPDSDPPGLAGDGPGSLGDITGPGVTGDVEIATGERKEDFYTFLVIGRDTGGGGNTDTILLASYDVGNQKLNVMSIPRDTMVNIPYDIKRINRVYNDGGGGEAGIQALYTEVSHLVGFAPDFYVTVEWKAIGRMVDAIGGVYFDVPYNMNYDDSTQNLHIHQAKGYRLLNGDDAMQVVRWRQNNAGASLGDIGRIEVQQSFLKAVIVQCLKLENVTKIGQFAQIFTENVQTDLSLGNLAWFGEQAVFGGLTMDNVNFVTMPGNYNATAWSRTYKNNQSYVLPYGDEILEMVNEYFNPYVEDRTASMQDIMSVNKNGTLSSTTGVVKDTWAATNGSGSRSSSTTTPSPSSGGTQKPNTTETPGTSQKPNETGASNPSQPPETTGDPNESETTPPSKETTPPSEPSGEGGTSAPGGQDEPPAAQDPIPTPTTWTPPVSAGDED